MVEVFRFDFLFRFIILIMYQFSLESTKIFKLLIDNHHVNNVNKKEKKYRGNFIYLIKAYDNMLTVLICLLQKI